MEYKDKKYILKKLMQDALTEEERIALQSSRRVTKEMERQWNNAPDAVESDRPDEPSIWRNICKEVWQHDEGRKVVFYKIYSMVASILLVLGVAGTVYFALQDKANVPMYVVSSGIQNMESVSLPDGTKVQMGPGSRLTYPARFSGKTREITLDGQAFFDVAKNREKPFIVHTEDMSVEALGTAFELFCYNMENKMEAILLNGKIKVSVADKETNERILRLSRRKDFGGPADRQDHQTDCGCRQIYRLAQTKDAEFRKRKTIHDHPASRTVVRQKGDVPKGSG